MFQHVKTEERQKNQKGKLLHRGDRLIDLEQPQTPDPSFPFLSELLVF